MTVQLDWTKLLTPMRRKDVAEGRTRRLNRTRRGPSTSATTTVSCSRRRSGGSRTRRRCSPRTQRQRPDEANAQPRGGEYGPQHGHDARFVHGRELGLDATVDATRNVPALLEAIGLAHDLGNPPFGHQGESAIQSWVRENSQPVTANPNSRLVFDGWDPTEAQKQDFLRFEGNAQAFRLLTRLQIVNDDFGLNMTYAFLGALMKYPVASDGVRKGVQARKKFNFFQSEADIAREVWEQTGLSEGVRHPLTLVMEACDDIAYSVVDVEDAAKKGLINFNVLIAWLDHHVGPDPVSRDVIDRSKARHAEFRGRDLSPRELDDITMQMFRVDAIGKMVPAAVSAFVANKDAILAGTFDRELMAASGAEVLWRSLKTFAKTHVYNHRRVLEVELKGHRTIHALMDVFWDGITQREGRDKDSPLTEARGPLPNYVYALISENYRRVAGAESNRMPMRYRELQLITDMISGMSDSFAVALHKDLRKLHG